MPRKYTKGTERKLKSWYKKHPKLADARRLKLRRNYSNRTRDEARKSGVCPTCLKGSPVKNCSECSICRDVGRARNRLRETGATPEWFKKTFLLQDGLCKICYTKLALTGFDTVVDHDHTTGKLRGILCRACNTGLGHFRDSSVILESAIDYLKETTSEKDKS